MISTNSIESVARLSWLMVFGGFFVSCYHSNHVELKANVPGRVLEIDLTQYQAQAQDSDKPVNPKPMTSETVAKDAKPIGDLPIKIDVDDLENKMIIVTASGHLPHRIFFREAPDTSMQFDLTMEPTTCTLKEKVATNRENLFYTKLLKAHTALLEKKFIKSKELASEIAKAKPHLAAPKVLLGLNAMYQGQNSEALQHFENALEANPNDSEIKSLIAFARERQDPLADGP